MSPSMPYTNSTKWKMYYYWLFCSVTWPWVAFIFNSIVLLCFKYIKGLTEFLSKNILVYESWPFKLEVSLVWSLSQRRSGQTRRKVNNEQLSESFQLCFFVSVRLQKQTVGIPVHCGLKQSCFTTKKPALSWSFVQSIWLVWPKKKHSYLSAMFS